MKTKFRAMTIVYKPFRKRKTFASLCEQGLCSLRRFRVSSLSSCAIIFLVSLLQVSKFSKLPISSKHIIIGAIVLVTALAARKLRNTGRKKRDESFERDIDRAVVKGLISYKFGDDGLRVFNIISDEALTLGEIAQRLSIPEEEVSSLLKGLEREGFLETI